MPRGIYERKPRTERPAAAEAKPARKARKSAAKKAPIKAQPVEAEVTTQPARLHLPSRPVQLNEQLYTWLSITAAVRGTTAERLLQEAVAMFIRSGE
jgi:hypothetical protein